MNGEQVGRSTARRRSKHAAVRDVRLKSALSPDDWIRGAFSLLVFDNIDAVRIDTLAKQLGVTRGSFYWHFADRDDLLQRLLEVWRDTATAKVIERFSVPGQSAAQQLRHLLLLPFHGKTAAQASSVEMAIREWARRDDTARKMLSEVDRQRLMYIAHRFVAMGFTDTDANLRAWTFYAFMQAEASLPHVLPEVQRHDRTNFLEQLLLRSPDESSKTAEGAVGMEHLAST